MIITFYKPQIAKASKRLEMEEKRLHNLDTKYKKVQKIQCNNFDC